MENQDIFNQFKKAADNAESPGFASMEKVWNRVEDKLDKKELKKTTNLWKKWAVAASILLGVSIGYQFLRNDQSPTKVNEIITQQDSVRKITLPKKGLATSETIHPDIRKDADIILEKQIGNQPMAVAEELSYDTDNIKSDSIAITVKSASNTLPLKNSGTFQANKFDMQSEKSKDVEVFIDKQNRVSSAKKEHPLLVFDNKAADKQTVKEIAMDEIESIVELKEPLYIINGIQYTEQELFGPNPTSPYTPLNKQEIDSISILQQEKAVSIYGEKGKKGVVIIFTKNGKPKGK